MGSPSAPPVEARPLASTEDFAACVELQLATWGRGFAEAVPGSILKICQKVGGVAAGAFDTSGRLLGFVFGLSGVRKGRLAHWSHMLAVAPAARDLGIGRLLKLYQRELLLPLGIEAVYWTYDPLEARNAHLNWNRLGVAVDEYVRDMYAGEMGTSDLAEGIGTDRFVVEWRIGGERVRRLLAGEEAGSGGSGGHGEPEFGAAPVAGLDGGLPGGGRVRVEVPASIQEVKAARPEEAAAWRAATRRAFESYLGSGYRVTAFYRDRETGRCFYGLVRETGG